MSYRIFNPITNFFKKSEAQPDPNSESKPESSDSGKVYVWPPFNDPPDGDN